MSRARVLEADASDAAIEGGLELLRAPGLRAWATLSAHGGAVATRLTRLQAELRKPRLLRSALAAAERGNLDAAFALLREASALRPDDDRTSLAFWAVAVACERAEAAAEPMARVVQREAAGADKGLAIAHWIALMTAAPAAIVNAAALARMLPELKAQVVAARDPEAREEARSWLVSALRQCLDPRGGGLTPGLALRVFEESRTLEPEVAHRAARIVLDSPDLHETKRARVIDLLASLDDPPPLPPEPEDDEPAFAPPLVVIDVVPVELTERALLLLEVDSDQRTRVDFRAVEAIAVARVEQGGAGFLILDLVLQRSRRRAPRRVLRLRDDRFDATALLPDEKDPGQALRALLASLFERTHAIPLPDPDSALGLEPRGFESVAAYEAGVLERLRR